MINVTPQGGEPTATKTCPLWSDNKALHARELAAAAEAARERLAKDQLTLDIDPLKDIARPAAPQTEDEARAELFTSWVAVNAEVQRLPSINHRAYLDKKLEGVLAMMNKAGVVERKDNFVEQIAFWRRQVEFCKRSPHHVFQQVGAHLGTRALTLWDLLNNGILFIFCILHDVSEHWTPEILAKFQALYKISFL